MKHALLLLMAIAMLFTSCHKSDGTTVTPASDAGFVVMTGSNNRDQLVYYYKDPIYKTVFFKGEFMACSLDTVFHNYYQTKGKEEILLMKIVGRNDVFHAKYVETYDDSTSHIKRIMRSFIFNTSLGEKKYYSPY